jgi:hypothetical protein
VRGPPWDLELVTRIEFVLDAVDDGGEPPRADLELLVLSRV